MGSDFYINECACPKVGNVNNIVQRAMSDVSPKIGSPERA